MANYAKAFFAGQRLLRQIFEYSNMKQVNRYCGNSALLSNFSDCHTVNEHVCKNITHFPRRSYSKYNTLKSAHIEVDYSRLSNLNGNIVKPGRSVPMLKQNIGRYFDLCKTPQRTEKNENKWLQTDRIPPKARQNHAYFLKRSLFNYTTSYDSKNTVKKQENKKNEIKDKKFEITSAFNYKHTPLARHFKVSNHGKTKVVPDIIEKAEPLKENPAKSSVHTIYRKSWAQPRSVENNVTNLSDILLSEKHKDLSILCAAPSRVPEPDLHTFSVYSTTPRENRNMIQLTAKQRLESEKKENINENVSTSTKISVKNSKDSIDSHSISKCQQYLEVCPPPSNPMGMDYSVKNLNPCEENGSKENSPEPCQTSILKDLDPNVVYAQTWTKIKLREISKFLKVPDLKELDPATACNDTIYVPQLRNLDPYEFYDFHTKLNQFKEKTFNSPGFSKTDEEPQNSKHNPKRPPPAEPPFENFNRKPHPVETERDRQLAGCEKSCTRICTQNADMKSLTAIVMDGMKPKESMKLKTNRIQATYIWVNENELSVKDRILTKKPKTVRDLPEWTSAESDESKNIQERKDYALVPKQYYNNPLKPSGGNLIILCDVLNSDLSDELSKRASCLKTIRKYMAQEPWFAFAQEYIVLNIDGRPLRWNKAKESVMAKELAQAHVDACLFAGLPFFGNTEQKTPGKWEYQIGPAFGINAADDLWVSRFILKRLAEKRNLQVTFDPKCLPRVTMNICTRVNFSTENMRKENGLKYIMEAVHRLGDHHSEMCPIYKQRRKQKFTWAIAKANVSVRIPKAAAQNGCGYLQDRRPAGDCDPYEISEAIMKVCLVPYKNESQA